MSDFQLFFQLGREHILDIHGHDHILFVVALCTMYLVQDWKKILILVTSFTIGHSLTLALVVLDIFSVNPEFIEFLIPLTILITAVTNIWQRDSHFENQKMPLSYFLALFFGLVHGMGFSNYLKSLLEGQESIVTELLAFNLGLELGQVIIVAVFMMLSFIVQTFGNVERRDWILATSSAVAGVALTLMIN